MANLIWTTLNGLGFFIVVAAFWSAIIAVMYLLWWSVITYPLAALPILFLVMCYTLGKEFGR